MTKDEIFRIAKEHIKSIFPRLSDAQIGMDESLRNLGANSIDRMEIITLTLDSLNLQVPLTECARVKTIRELVDLLAGKV